MNYSLFLHIGKSESVRKTSVVGIFDIETATMREDTRKYLKDRQDATRVVSLCGAELPKSFVVTDDENAETVYLTSISAASLLKREQSGNE